MERKKIFFYINAIHDGGAERVIIELARSFSKVGYHSVLITSFADINEYPVPDDVERLTMEQDQISQSRIKRNFSRIIKLRKLCIEYQPVAIISFMAEPNFRAIIATIGLPIKKIISVRNDPEREYAGRILRFVGMHILPYADGCVFQTEDAKKWFPVRLQNKSKVIFNAVSKQFFDADYVGGQNIITLGRLEEQKNHKLLIRAFSSIAHEYPTVNLEIFGVGKLQSELQELIISLNMKDRIFLRGLTTNSAEKLSQAKMFILSSDYEGMPNALMEALAVGVPCISTDCPCGGPRALIKNNENGLLISVNSENEMIAAMKKMLNHDAGALELGKNARKKAKEYSPECVFNIWRQYIEKVIDS